MHFKSKASPKKRDHQLYVNKETNDCEAINKPQRVRHDRTEGQIQKMKEVNEEG